MSSKNILLCLLFLLSAGLFSACLDGEVVRLQYQDDFSVTFVFPDSMRKSERYWATARPTKNPLQILIDSFSVSESSIKRLQIDTARIEITNPKNISLNAFDTLTLFYTNGTDEEVIGALGKSKKTKKTGLKTKREVSLHEFLLNETLQFKLHTTAADDIKDSVFLQFKFDVSVRGKALRN